MKWVVSSSILLAVCRAQSGSGDYGGDDYDDDGGFDVSLFDGGEFDDGAGGDATTQPMQSNVSYDEYWSQNEAEAEYFASTDSYANLMHLIAMDDVDASEGLDLDFLQNFFHQGIGSADSDLTVVDANGDTPFQSRTAYETIPGQTCGVGVATDRIVLGEAIDKFGIHPWQVAVFAQGREVSGARPTYSCCGGVIISQAAVLTAAHCVAQQSVSHIRRACIVAGEYIMNEDAITNNAHAQMKIARGVQDYHDEFGRYGHAMTGLNDAIIVHPDYFERDHEFDIAVLIADSDFTLDSRYIFPICLPDADTCLTSGDVMTATGWGALGGGHYQGSDTDISDSGPFDSFTTGSDGDEASKLRTVDLQLLELPACNAHGYNSLRMHPYHVCAGGVEDMKGICTGDSGGPLSYTMTMDDPSNPGTDINVRYLYGLSSFGWTGCGTGGGFLHLPDSNEHDGIAWDVQEQNGAGLLGDWSGVPGFQNIVNTNADGVQLGLNTASVFTRITAMVNWIEDNSNLNLPDTYDRTMDLVKAPLTGDMKGISRACLDWRRCTDEPDALAAGFTSSDTDINNNIQNMVTWGYPSHGYTDDDGNFVNPWEDSYYAVPICGEGYENINNFQKDKDVALLKNNKGSKSCGPSCVRTPLLEANRRAIQDYAICWVDSTWIYNEIQDKNFDTVCEKYKCTELTHNQIKYFVGGKIEPALDFGAASPHSYVSLKGKALRRFSTDSVGTIRCKPGHWAVQVQQDVRPETRHGDAQLAFRCATDETFVTAGVNFPGPDPCVGDCNVGEPFRTLRDQIGGPLYCAPANCQVPIPSSQCSTGICNSVSAHGLEFQMEALSPSTLYNANAMHTGKYQLSCPVGFSGASFEVSCKWSADDAGVNGWDYAENDPGTTCAPVVCGEDALNDALANAGLDIVMVNGHWADDAPYGNDVFGHCKYGVACQNSANRASPYDKIGYHHAKCQADGTWDISGILAAGFSCPGTYCDALDDNEGAVFTCSSGFDDGSNCELSCDSTVAVSNTMTFVSGSALNSAFMSCTGGMWDDGTSSDFGGLVDTHGGVKCTLLATCGDVPAGEGVEFDYTQIDSTIVDGPQTEGARAHAKCMDGYAGLTNGASHFQCNNAGEWIRASDGLTADAINAGGSFISCTRTCAGGCGAPTAIADGSFTSDDAVCPHSEGATVTFACSAGHTITDKQTWWNSGYTQTCENGEWSDMVSSPQCVPDADMANSCPWFHMDIMMCVDYKKADGSSGWQCRHNNREKFTGGMEGDRIKFGCAKLNAADAANGVVKSDYYATVDDDGMMAGGTGEEFFMRCRFGEWWNSGNIISAAQLGEFSCRGKCVDGFDNSASPYDSPINFDVSNFDTSQCDMYNFNNGDCRLGCNSGGFPRLKYTNNGGNSSPVNHNLLWRCREVRGSTRDPIYTQWEFKRWDCVTPSQCQLLDVAAMTGKLQWHPVTPRISLAYDSRTDVACDNGNGQMDSSTELHCTHPFSGTDGLFHNYLNDPVAGVANFVNTDFVKIECSNTGDEQYWWLNPAKVVDLATKCKLRCRRTPSGFDESDWIWFSCGFKGTASLFQAGVLNQDCDGSVCSWMVNGGYVGVGHQTHLKALYGNQAYWNACESGGFTDGCNEDIDCKMGEECSSNACVDVDDCAGSPCDHTCTDGWMDFTCSCDSGYTLDDDGATCNDINECWYASDNDCEDVCNNTDGGYTCSCSSQFFTESGNSCVDINECTANNACAEFFDESAEHFACINEDGGYECVDYDECADSDGFSYTQCDQHDRCVNFFGNFGCSCDAGYDASVKSMCNDSPVDGSNFCRDVDDGTCTNIDECDIGTHGCSDTHSGPTRINECEDYVPRDHGGQFFQCSCNADFVSAGTITFGSLADGHGTCDDVNECLDIDGATNCVMGGNNNVADGNDYRGCVNFDAFVAASDSGWDCTCAGTLFGAANSRGIKNICCPVDHSDSYDDANDYCNRDECSAGRVGGSPVCTSQNPGWVGEISGFATCADIDNMDDGNGLGYTCTIAGTDMVFFNEGSQDVEDVDECALDFTASSSATFNGCLGSNNDHPDSGAILDSSVATCVNRGLDDYDLVNDDAGYTCTCSTGEPATVVPAGDDGHPGGTNQPVYVCCGASQTYNGGNNECA